MTFSIKSIATRLFPKPSKPPTSKAQRLQANTRILYVANGFIPTLQICFINPLSALSKNGEVVSETLTEQQLKSQFAKKINRAEADQSLEEFLADFTPNVIIFCRYSGPRAEELVSYAQKNAVSVIYHLDDDLLNVPIELGQAKYDFHNHPDRIQTVNYLLQHAHIVYCSTVPLRDRLAKSGEDSHRYFAGPLHCTSEILARAVPGPVRKIGYMGFDHEHDLKPVVPSLVRILEKYPEIEFDLFGKIPKPKALDCFGSRVNMIPVELNYQDFMQKMKSLGWQIGICPLADTEFNKTKSDNKWVEYSAVGAAVIASAGTVYDDCCAGGCGLLVESADRWESSFIALIERPDFRQELVERAQRKLMQQYAPAELKDQIFHVISLANDEMNRQRKVSVESGVELRRKFQTNHLSTDDSSQSLQTMTTTFPSADSEGRIATPHVDDLSDADLALLNEMLPWQCFTLDSNGRQFGKAASSTKRNLPQIIPDRRIVDLDRRFPLSGSTVLEVGCFEGIHTIALAACGAKVIGIDSRIENVVKTNVRLWAFGIEATIFRCDVEQEVDFAKIPTVDITHHIGVLYHLVDPVTHLLKILAQTRKAIVLDTHYAKDAEADRVFELHGVSYRYKHYREKGRSQAFAGMYDHAKWLTLDTLVGLLKGSGFSNVDVAELRDERNGARTLIYASR